MFFTFLNTILASAEKHYRMAVNDTGSIPLGCAVQFPQRCCGLKLHIINPAALPAHKMIVFIGVSIEVIGSVPAADPADLTGFNQQIQIAVNRPQTDVGKFLTDAGV